MWSGAIVLSITVQSKLRPRRGKHAELDHRCGHCRTTHCVAVRLCVQSRCHAWAVPGRLCLRPAKRPDSTRRIQQLRPILQRLGHGSGHEWRILRSRRLRPRLLCSAAIVSLPVRRPAGFELPTPKRDARRRAIPVLHGQGTRRFLPPVSGGRDRKNQQPRGQAVHGAEGVLWQFSVFSFQFSVFRDQWHTLVLSVP